MIERARKEKSTRLVLSPYTLHNFPLNQIPVEVFEFSELKELDLSYNNISGVPERIRELTNLKHLNLIGNPITNVPDIPGLSLDWITYRRCRRHLSAEHVEGISIGVDAHGFLLPKHSRNLELSSEFAHFSGLRSLWVEGPISAKFRKPLAGNIRVFIENIGSLRQLKTLSISDVVLGVVPDGIRGLQQLRVLSLSNVGLVDIPDWIGELEKLRELNLEDPLVRLPVSLANLKQLEVLNLADTRLIAIPDVVFQLPNLKALRFWCLAGLGSIQHVPAAILRLPKLEHLNVDGQPIATPPPEVVKEGLEAIRNYWRQQEEVGVDYLAEAKLIIVGEAGAGKSSLARKIRDPEYTLKPQELSTEGIDVIRWGFPSAVRVQREGVEALHQTEFHASIWDFGGQEIYHATHQFFLTRRSLYALVADDRKEDTDFNWWLQVVELLSDGSPLLIVQNEKQDRQRDIDVSTLRAHFPNLRDTFSVNLATNRGLGDLVTAIRQELERLPHIGTPMPRTWSKVRAALENDPRQYIGLDEYLAICEANGFTRREDKLQLSGYLHDLGICLHFQDDPVLKNTVILKPKWGTDAVYRVLDDHTILDHRGRFNPADLARIWYDPQYLSMRDELLALMMRFQLCYRLEGTQAYIAPQLLSPTRPAYTWASDGGLVVRYDYEFMPKGILTRFIVAVNHLIEDQDLVWKSGVILVRNGSRSEVIEDYPRRKITVRVTGADTRGLLAIVDDQLERIHASFPRMKYDKYLPCNCEVCRKRDEPFAYPLSELVAFATERDRIQCRISRKLVDAAELIRDVLPSAVEMAKEKRTRLMVHALLSEPMPSVKEVFVSYAWSDESTGVVDRLQAALADRGVAFLRDRNEIRYRDSIRSFMERIGRGKCIVVVVSKKYLESKNCMFEMTEIAERGDIHGRVFPIVLPDADIYDASGRLRYIKHWEQKRKELDAEMKDVSGEYLQGIREDLDLYARIRHTVGRITNILGDMNALTAEEHQASGFDALLQALEDPLSN